MNPLTPSSGSDDGVAASKRNEFRRALLPMHRCRFFRNTIWDAYGDLPLQVMWGWRKDCPCAQIK